MYCFFNGFSETCTDVGGFVYSLHQTSDGGYLLAGDSNLEMSADAPIEAWQAKVDATGNLVWQHLYYQTYAPTGRPLGEFFPAAARGAGPSPPGRHHAGGHLPHRDAAHLHQHPPRLLTQPAARAMRATGPGDARAARSGQQPEDAGAAGTPGDNGSRAPDSNRVTWGFRGLGPPG